MSSLSQSQKDLVLSISKQNGFEGFKSDRGYIKGQPHARTKVVKTLDLFEQLKSSNIIEGMGLAVNWESLKGEVESYLFSIKKEAKVIAANASGIEEVKDGSENYKGLISAGIRIVRSAFKDGLETYTGRLNTGQPPLIFIDVNRRRILTTRDIAPDIFLLEMGITDPKELIYDQSVPVVYPEFRPYSVDMIIHAERKDAPGKKFSILNTYPCPEWRKIKAIPQYRGNIRKLLENIFPLEEERQYVLCWIRQMIVGRNNTVLVLVGDRGVGKSKFGELLQALVGLEFSQMLDMALLKDKFTSQVYHTRLGVFEEVGLGGEDQTTVERVKALTNARIKVEKKNRDAFSASNECSFVMSLNSSSNLGVRPTERRFSIPLVLGKKLEDAIPSFEISKMEKTWLGQEIDPQVQYELAEFGEYLLAMDVGTWSDSTPLRGKAFYEITRAAQPDWELAIIDMVIKAGQINKQLEVKDVIKYMANKPANGFRTKPTTISSFLRDYKHFNEHKLGTLDFKWGETGRGRSAIIIPNPEFLEAYGEHPEKMVPIENMDKYERLNAKADAIDAAKAAAAAAKVEDLL